VEDPATGGGGFLAKHGKERARNIVCEKSGYTPRVE